MANLENALQQLRAERRVAQLHNEEVRSSDFGDRLVKRFQNIPEQKPTEANNIGSFSSENGAGAKSEMGEGESGEEEGGLKQGLCWPYSL